MSAHGRAMLVNVLVKTGNQSADFKFGLIFKRVLLLRFDTSCHNSQKHGRRTTVAKEPYYFALQLLALDGLYR